MPGDESARLVHPLRLPALARRLRPPGGDTAEAEPMTHAGRTWPPGVGARHLAGKLITLCGALGELADVPADAECPECRRALERRRDALADLLTAELDPVSELMADLDLLGDLDPEAGE